MNSFELAMKNYDEIDEQIVEAGSAMVDCGSMLGMIDIHKTPAYYNQMVKEYNDIIRKQSELVSRKKDMTNDLNKFSHIEDLEYI